jgi:beta-N-acetylhexosaminidase
VSGAGDFHPGQLVMVGIRGKTLGPDQAAFLRRHRIRAVVLFRDNIGDEDELRALTRDLREALGPRALIAVDQEGGSVVRVTFLPQPPAAMALGAAADEALARDVGAAVARGLKSLGFNWNFAPVADVNNDPENPVIGERSFSADPREVARLGGAWMRGALSEGVACCIKHFPGHGDTSVDSHLDLPIVDKPRASLDALELLPFRALQNDAPAIMTAHIVYSRLDADRPATLSHAVLSGLLRDELGYDGVVITDSLVMKAIHDRYGHGPAAVMALAAGADVVMALGSEDEQAAAIEAIGEGLASGELTQVALARSQARLDRLAARFPVRPGPYASETRLADAGLMRRAWASGLTALNEAKPLPVDRPVRVITQRRVPSDGISEAGLSGDRVAVLFAGFADAEIVQVEDLASLEALPRSDDPRPTILASNIRARYPDAASNWRPDLHLILWNPFQAFDLPVPSVITWGYAEGALDALRAWLEGRADAPGRAPVPLKRSPDPGGRR